MSARVSHIRGIVERARPQTLKVVRQSELVFWRSGRVGWLDPTHQALTLISFVRSKKDHVFARFAPNGSTEEHLRALRDYIERMGCPKLIVTAEGLGSMSQLPRALQELGISWTSQNHAEADGPSMQLFRDVHQRIVPSFQKAGISTLESANRYLDDIYLPHWNPTRETSRLEVKPAPAKEELDSILSVVTLRVMNSRSVLRYKNRTYGMPLGDVPNGLRGSVIRIEARLDGSLHFRLADQKVPIELIERGGVGEDSPAQGKKLKRQRRIGGYNPSWMKGFLDRPSPLLWKSFGTM
jgi:hypothetical protein